MFNITIRYDLSFEKPTMPLLTKVLTLLGHYSNPQYNIHNTKYYIYDTTYTYLFKRSY